MSATSGRLTAEGFQPHFSLRFPDPEESEIKLGAQAATSFNHEVFDRWMLAREPMFWGHCDEMPFDTATLTDVRGIAVHGVVEGNEASHFDLARGKRIPC